MAGLYFPQPTAKHGVDKIYVSFYSVYLFYPIFGLYCHVTTNKYSEFDLFINWKFCEMYLASENRSQYLISKEKHTAHKMSVEITVIIYLSKHSINCS